jgi:deoxyribonuclease V
VRCDRLGRIRRVAGADVAFDLLRGRAIAGVIVYDVVGQASSLYSFSLRGSKGRTPGFPLVELERASAMRPLMFPYVPGLLSFREAPALLAAFEKLRHAPDVIFVDGQGYAHPRRFGIACHLGVLLATPTVGCAKSRLIGTHAAPPRTAGAWTALQDGGETVGAVLCTRSGVNPIYLSAGHRLSLNTAIRLTLAVCDGFRIPKPTREADHFVEALKREIASQGQAGCQNGTPSTLLE